MLYAAFLLHKTFIATNRSDQFDLDKPVVLFDGVCGLCSSTVNYVMKHDRNATFFFTPLQSPYGQMLLAKAGRHRTIWTDRGYRS